MIVTPVAAMTDDAERGAEDPGAGRAGKSDGGVGMNEPEVRGQSETSPGHQKPAQGSARDVAPGHAGRPPGQEGRDSGENARETPELDSFHREG